MKEKEKMGERERERYGTLYNADDDDDGDTMMNEATISA